MANKKTLTCAAVVYTVGGGDDESSDSPLVMQPLAGLPVIQHTLDLAREVTGNPATLITDRPLGDLGEFHSGNIIAIPAGGSFTDGIRQAATLLRDSADRLLFLQAEMPLLTASQLEAIIAGHWATSSSSGDQPVVTMTTFKGPASLLHERVLRGADDQVIEILPAVSHSSIPGEEVEFDAGIYCYSSTWFWENQKDLPHSGLGATPLSTLVKVASSAGLNINSLEIVGPNEALRINSRVELSEAETVLRTRINHALMRSGVTILDPNATYIDRRVTVGRDTIIHPNTYLRGETRIGSGCTIGPNSMITDTLIGDHCEVIFSVAESAVLEDHVDIGPFAHLRKGAHLAQGVHMGNYGEIKNSYLGPGTKMGHFSYIGDANIGPGVNIGAGVITANYDGRNKHQTEIGAGAFIGSDTMLIAPVKIGAGARTGAGSVVTKDVPPNSLAVGIPARIIRKLEENDGP